MLLVNFTAVFLAIMSYCYLICDYVLLLPHFCCGFSSNLNCDFVCVGLCVLMILFIICLQVFTLNINKDIFYFFLIFLFWIIFWGFVFNFVLLIVWLVRFRGCVCRFWVFCLYFFCYLQIMTFVLLSLRCLVLMIMLLQLLQMGLVVIIRYILF